MPDSTQPTTAVMLRWLSENRQTLDPGQQEFVDQMLRMMREQEEAPSFHNAYTMKQVSYIKGVYEAAQRSKSGTLMQKMNDMLDDLLEATNLSGWETEFVDSLDKQRRANPGRAFTLKQEQALGRAHKKRIIHEEDGRER